MPVVQFCLSSSVTGILHDPGQDKVLAEDKWTFGRVAFFDAY